MKWNIVTDSSSDLYQLDKLSPDTCFSSVPLHIQVGAQSYIDDGTTDTKAMMEAVYAHQGPTSSACPSPHDWIEAFSKGDNTIAVTITSKMSGSYSSALSAASIFQEMHPKKNVYVLDSKSVAGEMVLLLEELNRLVSQNLSFETVVEKINDYNDRTRLLCYLQRTDNLVKNGRISRLKGAVVGLLGIRIVGEASEEGVLKMVGKHRSEEKALQSMAAIMVEQGYHGGPAVINHCHNEAAANKMKKILLSQFGNADIRIMPSGALCSYYEELGGMIIGYETPRA